MDCMIHRIIQDRILEVLAFPFSRGSSQPWDQTQVSQIAGEFFSSWAGREAQKESERLSVLSDSLRPHGLYNPWNSPGQNTGVGSLPLLQGIFLTQESNQEVNVVKYKH